MPNIEMERLEKDSSDSQVQAAISACIQMEMSGGMDQKQAIAACMSMAKEKAGMREMMQQSMGK